jgi:hypothetical protein
LISDATIIKKNVPSPIAKDIEQPGGLSASTRAAAATAARDVLIIIGYDVDVIRHFDERSSIKPVLKSNN